MIFITGLKEFQQVIHPPRLVSPIRFGSSNSRLQQLYYYVAA